jgi:hypothetical protein
MGCWLAVAAVANKTFQEQPNQLFMENQKSFILPISCKWEKDVFLHRIGRVHGLIGENIPRDP